MDTVSDSERITTDGTGEVDDEFVNKDVPRLFTRWRNEKYAPELLPFDQEVTKNIAELVEFVGGDLEMQRGEDEAFDPNEPNFCLRCVDLERIKYLLRDYLRIRLWKISQWPLHYLEPGNMKQLSEAERNFLREFWRVKSGFFEHRLLGALPPSKQSLEDRMDLLDMVRRPQQDKHVYARLLENVGPMEVPPTHSQDTGAAPEPLQLVAGNTYLLRWVTVRKFFMEPEHEGKVLLV